MSLSLQISLLLIGLLHTPPAISGLSAHKLATLYKVDTSDRVLLVLLHHRAVLFALLAAACYYAAFTQTLAVEVSIAAFIAMLSFVGISLAIPHQSPAIKKIALADVVGTVVLAAGWAIQLLGE
jgi:hypothetical protein